MRLLLVLLAVAAAAGPAPIRAHGVQVVAPPGWHRVPATPSAIADPRTVLVAGTRGVVPDIRTPCEVAAYAVPPRSAAIVVLRWRTRTSGGGSLPPGRRPLARLVAVARPSFECFRGRGAAAQVALGAHAYQVNVLVGDRASPALVAQALAAARTFDVS